jgi:hypothetical protein
VDDRAWSWRHGKKAQVGGEVCVSNDSQRLLAAAETENDGRGAQQQLRCGTCFVFMFYICLEFVSQQTSMLCMMIYYGRIGTTSSFPGRDTRKVCRWVRLSE